MTLKSYIETQLASENVRIKYLDPVTLRTVLSAFVAGAAGWAVWRDGMPTLGSSSTVPLSDVRAAACEIFDEEIERRKATSGDGHLERSNELRERRYSRRLSAAGLDVNVEIKTKSDGKARLCLTGLDIGEESGVVQFLATLAGRRSECGQ